MGNGKRAKTTKTNSATRNANERRNGKRLRRREVVLVFSQARISVTTGAPGLIVIEPILDMRLEMRVENGNTEVVPDQTF